MCISDAEFEEFDIQVTDALESLTEDEDFFQTLFRYPGIEKPVLDFGTSRTEEDFVINFRFPSELTSICGRLGLDLWISSYPCSEDGSEECSR